MSEENFLQDSPSLTPETSETLPNSTPATPFGNPLPNITDLSNTTSPDTLQLAELGNSEKPASNIFLENTPIESSESEGKEKENFVSSYIRRFIMASVITIINVLLIGLVFSYRIYIKQTSQVYVDNNYKSFVSSFQIYLKDFTKFIKINKEALYAPLPIITPENTENITTITRTDELTYAEKKTILREKISALNSTITNQINEVESTKKDIAKYGFLPLEIREILQNEEAISAIQRSLNALEIIKFSTAIRVFSYMDSTMSLIGDSLRITKDAVFKELELLAQREEKDITAYVYMCYLNPFEVSQNCTTIGDLDLYYQDIIKEPTFDRTLFKGIMKYIDIILEQSDIPSFSILFHGFDPSQGNINFDIEINTTKADELKLIAKGIKNPHIFILTNLINLLKQSIFIIGADIDTKTITISTRTIDAGNVSYTVNTSSKQFNLPIQKTTEREIFDYIDIDSLLQLDQPTEKAEPSETPTEITEVSPDEEATPVENLPDNQEKKPLPTEINTPDETL
ncbi:MAG: hypothetical protein LBU27_01110 [Candidatus Peribacteria bacterium]|jgi:hypothetical protein|nr:hypothetical protein [Candidatus Peribacteria bacterium]